MLTNELFSCRRPIRHLRGPSKGFHDDDVLLGVEIETENCGLSISHLNKHLTYWDTKKDGSLKSQFPYEFVFKEPLQGATAEAALLEIESMLDKSCVVYPHNTSVHVHVDVSSLGTEELRSFVYLAISLESALVKISGNRRNNVFCMPYGKSDGNLLTALGRVLEYRHMDRGIDWVHLGKYSTVNFSSVPVRGTVEFRTHVGTHNFSELQQWINVLLLLRKYAVESSFKGKAKDVIDYTMSNKTLVEYMREIWPNNIVSQMLHKELHTEVLESSLKARLSLFPKSTSEFLAWVGGQEFFEPDFPETPQEPEAISISNGEVVHFSLNTGSTNVFAVEEIDDYGEEEDYPEEEDTDE